MKDLKLWQEAVALGGDVLRLARNTSRRETKTFNDEIIRSALAVGIAIADGYGEYETLEQRNAYRTARRHLATLETQLAIGRQGGVIPPGALTPISVRQASVHRLLSGYLAYVERQVEAETLAAGAQSVQRRHVTDPGLHPVAAAAAHEPFDEIDGAQSRQ